MEQLTLNVSGMSCGHCVARVTNALNGVTGVEVGNVNVGSATVAYDPALVSPTQIATALGSAGYTAQPAAQTA
ncbi:MAG: cation transporter [Gemmatimonadota bacterium]|nr:cation transporter [Gemmatimonadota bacterium]